MKYLCTGNFKKGPAFEMSSGEPTVEQAKVHAVKVAKYSGFTGQVKNVIAQEQRMQL